MFFKKTEKKEEENIAEGKLEIDDPIEKRDKKREKMYSNKLCNFRN